MGGPVGCGRPEGTRPWPGHVAQWALERAVLAKPPAWLRRREHGTAPWGRSCPMALLQRATSEVVPLSRRAQAAPPVPVQIRAGPRNLLVPRWSLADVPRLASASLPPCPHGPGRASALSASQRRRAARLLPSSAVAARSPRTGAQNPGQPAVQARHLPLWVRFPPSDPPPRAEVAMRPPGLPRHPRQGDPSRQLRGPMPRRAGPSAQAGPASSWPESPRHPRHRRRDGRRYGGPRRHRLVRSTVPRRESPT